MKDTKDRLAEQLKRLVTMWQDIAQGKLKVHNPVPASVEERLQELDKMIELHEKNSQQAFKDIGLDVSDPEKFIRDHADEFDSRDRLILLTIAKMKGEVKYAKNQVRDALDGKDWCNDKSMLEAEQPGGGSQEDEETHKKKIRARKKRFKKAGLDNKWQKL
ncbi:MAG: hypothetical protein ACQEP8_05250 [Chlamydiota bacterium]